MQNSLSLVKASHAGGMNDQSDYDLMVALKAGSERALEIIMKRHEPLLRSVATRILSNYAEVDDVVEDVFLHVWNKSGDYSADKGQLLGWLVTITRRRALDRVRQRTSRGNAADRLEIKLKAEKSHFTPDNNATMREVQYREAHRQIDDMIASLPGPQADVFELMLKGFSQRQIAAKLDLPLGTVKTRLELAIRKIGRKLNPSAPREFETIMRSKHRGKPGRKPAIKVASTALPVTTGHHDVNGKIIESFYDDHPVVRKFGQTTSPDDARLEA